MYFAMSLFSRKKSFAAESFVLKLVNNSRSCLQAMQEGPRVSSRVNLTLAVAVIPMEKKKPRFDQLFYAVTKEFSSCGMAIITRGPCPLERAIIGIPWENEIQFLLASAKHTLPIGGNFYQLGFELEELIPPSDYPELANVKI